jgi:hypothetical protein
VYSLFVVIPLRCWWRKKDVHQNRSHTKLVLMKESCNWLDTFYYWFWRFFLFPNVLECKFSFLSQSCSVYVSIKSYFLTQIQQTLTYGLLYSLWNFSKHVYISYCMHSSIVQNLKFLENKWNTCISFETFGVKTDRKRKFMVCYRMYRFLNIVSQMP